MKHVTCQRFDTLQCHCMYLLPVKHENLVGQIFIIFSTASLKSYKHGFVASVRQVLRKLVVAHSPHIRDAHDHTPGSHAHKYPGERGMMIMGEYSSRKSLSILNFKSLY